MKSCQVCGLETKNNCSNCHQVYYCSIEHQKQDWKVHKTNCHPFKIESNEQLGRHLITTRKIKAFEVILKESPLLQGPLHLTPSVCLGCLNAIEPNDYLVCEHCGWLLCGRECKHLLEHQKFECQLTQERGEKVQIKQFTNPHPMYQCISVIRALMLRNVSPDLWSKFNELESLEHKRRHSKQWQLDYETVCKFIKNFFHTAKYTEDEIMRTIGILQINGHEVPNSEPPHVAVFYKASYLEHSCLPNLAKSFTEDGNLMLWAPKSIAKGSHLSISYTDAVWGTHDRQRHLLQTKIFECNCCRCTDITEFGTKYDAVKCTQANCSTGLVLPLSSTDFNKEWRCEKCQSEMDASVINKILLKAGCDFAAMEKTTENCFRYLKHYDRWLPAHHYYMCEVKVALVQTIGKTQEDLLTITDEDLQIKLNYGQEIIQLYEILTPCEVRMLGVLHFAVHSALAELARRKALQTNNTSKELLIESLRHAEKCIDYLQYEADIFVEGMILKQAKINCNALKLVTGS